MSLRVWLPLTKDLRNQGLDDVTITNNGATFTNGGKLGEKYFSDGIITIPASSSNSIFNGTHMSFSFWLKPIGTSGTSVIFGQSSMSAGNNRMYSIFQYPTPNDLHISWQSETSNSTFIGFSISGFFEADKWTHCALVYDGSKLLVYKNGVLNGTYNGVNTRTAFNYDYPINGSSIRCLNDFRIYDHCLSPLEVKKLAQGLVLHYPLNRGGWGQENLALNTAEMHTINNKCNWVVGSIADGVATLTGDGAWRSVGVHNGLKLADYKSKTITVSADIKAESSDATYRPIVEFRTNVSPYSSARVYRYKTVPLIHAKSNHIPITSWQRFYCSLTFNTGVFTSYDNANMNVEPDWENGYWGIHIFNHGNVSYQVRNIKIEEGSIATPWCPNSSDALAATMGLNSTTEYDTSGFCNNGTRTGTFSWTSDTPKYSVSSVHTGSNYIYLDSPPTGTQTIAVWAKWNTIPSGQSIILVDNGSSIGLGLMSTGILCSTSGAGNSNTFSKANLVANTWYHFVIVKTGTTARKLYINGVEQTATSNTSNWTYSVNQLQLGKRSTTSDGFAGKLCDFRAYATALSADDVLDLYNNTYTVN